MRGIRMDAESGEKEEPADRFASKRTTLTFMRAIMRARTGCRRSVRSRKTEVGGAVCCSFPLRDCVSLYKRRDFSPIPRNRRRYVRIRSVPYSYELHDIFLFSRFFLAGRNESEEIVVFGAQNIFIMNDGGERCFVRF